MKRPWRHLFVIAWFCPLSSVFAQTVGIHANDLHSLEDRVAFLKWVESQIPDFYTQAFKYQDNYYRILNDQLKVQEHLLANEDYQKKIQGKSNFLEIELRTPANPAASESQWNLKQAEEDLLRVRSRFTNDEHLITRLSEIENLLQKRTSQGMLAGLIQALPPEERKNLGKTNESRIAALKQGLPDVIPETFRGQEYGLQPPYAKEEVLSQFESRIRLETELQELRFAHAVGTRPNPAQIESALNSMKIPEYRLSTPVIKEIAPAIDLTLKEVPSALSVFRGCVGGDCSTQKSFMFANLQSEHVLFIQAKDRSLKGYLQFSTLQAGGKPAIYIHTLNGARLRSEEVTAILNALPKIASSVGAESAYFPQSSRLKATVNFDEIRSQIEKFSDSRKRVNVQFEDVADRKQLEKFKTILGPKTSRHYTAEYDQMKKINFVHPLSAHQLKPGSIDVQIKKIPIAATPLQAPTTLDKTLFLIMASDHEHPDVVKQYANELKIDHSRLERFKALLGDPGTLKIEDWKQKLADQYRELDPEGSIRPFKAMIDRNQILAVDAFSSAHEEGSMRTLSRQLSSIDALYRSDIDTQIKFENSISRAGKSAAFREWMIQELRDTDPKRAKAIVQFLSKRIDEEPFRLAKADWKETARAVHQTLSDLSPETLKTLKGAELRNILIWGSELADESDLPSLQKVFSKLTPQDQRFFEIKLQTLQSKQKFECSAEFLQKLLGKH